MEKKTEQEHRKELSNTLLENHGIPTLASLPVLPSADEKNLRNKEEICERAFCLTLIALYADGLPKEVAFAKARVYNVEHGFTEAEESFLNMEECDQITRDQFTWRYESLYTLLWSLSYVETLDLPTDISDIENSIRIVLSRSRKDFIENAKLRSEQEILDQADLIYRIHWAARNARLKRETLPAGLNNDVVYERHYALNWLIKLGDEDWDHVRTDT